MTFKFPTPVPEMPVRDIAAAAKSTGNISASAWTGVARRSGWRGSRKADVGCSSRTRHPGGHSATLDPL